jgi:hypothetical protein
MKFKISLIAILSVLVLNISGCEDDNLTSKISDNQNSSDYINKSDDDNIDEKISSLDYTLNIALDSNDDYTQDELGDIL